MPPKGKGVASKLTKELQVSSPPLEPPRSINEQSSRRRDLTQPYDSAIATGGLASLSPQDRSAWVAAHYLCRPSIAKKLPNRVAKDAWKHVNETSTPLLTLLPSPPPPPENPQPGAPQHQQHSWGKDRSGRDVGEYTPEEFAARQAQRSVLTALQVGSRLFRERRERAEKGYEEVSAAGGVVGNRSTGEKVVLTDQDVQEERDRRREIARLRMELYGVRSNPYAEDPEWDDVTPIPIDEPRGALAAIAYPENYAEAISYLRAVMAAKEHSPRCLKLTEHIISLNPAHYTVWLYRFSIIAALGSSIEDEIRWVNDVSLQHLKNYQIWHHRHLLLDAYYPQIAADEIKIAELIASETDFLAQVLAEDTKNYHVWSYRQDLTRKLGNWSDAELRATEAFIEGDVRNNSAWSHRFFLVFSNPAHSTLNSVGTERDDKIPAQIIDREIAYAQEKIRLAPQNQSPWNYLRGVLVKGGRALSSVEGFASEFVRGVVDDVIVVGSEKGKGKGKEANIGDGDKNEDVKSTHAMDLLAEIYAEKGEIERADVLLRRLAEKWDRIRTGYWEWRRKCLQVREPVAQEEGQTEEISG